MAVGSCNLRRRFRLQVGAVLHNSVGQSYGSVNYHVCATGIEINQKIALLGAMVAGYSCLSFRNGTRCEYRDFSEISKILDWIRD